MFVELKRYKLGGRDFESEVFKRQDGDKSGLLDFGEFVSLFRKVLKLSPKTCSDLDVRTVFEYMGGNYEEGVHQDRFKEFLDEDFNLDYATRRLKVSGIPVVLDAAVLYHIFAQYVLCMGGCYLVTHKYLRTIHKGSQVEFAAIF